MNQIEFARALSRLEEHLDWHVHLRAPCQCDGDIIAASYRKLIDNLTELGDQTGVADALASAVMTFEHLRVARAASTRAGQARREAEYAEELRRHGFAVQVDCPYCGAQPGDQCRTAGGPSGGGYPKGTADHKDRWRAAQHLTGAAEQPDAEAVS